MEGWTETAHTIQSGRCYPLRGGCLARTRTGIQDARHMLPRARITDRVLGLHVGPALDQQPRRLLVAVIAGNVQRRPPILQRRQGGGARARVGGTWRASPAMIPPPLSPRVPGVCTAPCSSRKLIPLQGNLPVHFVDVKIPPRRMKLSSLIDDIVSTL